MFYMINQNNVSYLVNNRYNIIQKGNMSQNL